MPRYFAQIDKDNTVTQVIVCDNHDWLQEKFGGTWIETKMEEPLEQYAGIGMKVDTKSNIKFAHEWKEDIDFEIESKNTTYYFRNGKIETHEKIEQAILVERSLK